MPVRRRQAAQQDLPLRQGAAAPLSAARPAAPRQRRALSRLAHLFNHVAGCRQVFGPDSTQERLFNQAISPIVEEVLDGFNCTIFAYGQTGTGKTFTMEGGPRNSSDGKDLSAAAGVIPRSIKQIFDTIEATENDSSVKVSFLELYNEELTDLLATDESK